MTVIPPQVIQAMENLEKQRLLIKDPYKRKTEVILFMGSFQSLVREGMDIIDNRYSASNNVERLDYIVKSIERTFELYFGHTMIEDRPDLHE